MNNIIKGLLVLSMVSFMGCSASNTQNENTTLGAVTGAVVGGLAGSLVGGGTGKAVAIGAGIVGGALIGGYMGQSMESSDQAKMDNAMSHNSTGQHSSWTNKNTGAKYTVEPTSQRMAMNGHSNCRRYHTTATINGQTKQVYGVACMKSDGTWQAIQS